MNEQWLNTNELRKYPVRDDASALDNFGRALPASLIADLCLVVPPGYNPYLRSVRVTPYLVSVSIASGEQGLLLCTKPRASITPGKAYPFTPAVANVSGWIAFGPYAPSREETYVFSSEAQSGFVPSVVTRSRVPAVSSVSKHGAPDRYAIAGAIRLAAGSGIECVLDPSNDKRIILRLKEDVRSFFVGPCNATSSESACGATPIRTINGVDADENGVITLRFL